tara:strand:+ start:252 stop:494 length:243 start_codon:yes stop_codon:yes gene_type:complete
MSSITTDERSDEGVDSNFLFCFDDLLALRELLPPKRGELLRRWMMRCTCKGLTTCAEAMRIKTDNPESWDNPYILEQNAK